MLLMMAPAYVMSAGTVLGSLRVARLRRGSLTLAVVDVVVVVWVAIFLSIAMGGLEARQGRSLRSWAGSWGAALGDSPPLQTRASGGGDFPGRQNLGWRVDFPARPHSLCAQQPLRAQPELPVQFSRGGGPRPRRGGWSAAGVHRERGAREAAHRRGRKSPWQGTPPAGPRSGPRTRGRPARRGRRGARRGRTREGRAPSRRTPPRRPRRRRRAPRESRRPLREALRPREATTPLARRLRPASTAGQAPRAAAPRRRRGASPDERTSRCAPDRAPDERGAAPRADTRRPARRLPRGRRRPACSTGARACLGTRAGRSPTRAGWGWPGEARSRRREGAAA